MRTTHALAVRASRPRWDVAAAMAVLLTPLAPAPASAQVDVESSPGRAAQDAVRSRPLSLEQAIAEALEGNAELRIATARRAVAEAEASGASAVYWPRLDLESGFIRSADPVFAFGTKLRQESFTQDDFALERLNRPDPINDWANSASLRWKVFSPAEWAARSGAAHGAESARWFETRSREATVLRTETHYLQAQREAAQRAAALRAEEAARSARDVFARRAEEGLLTRAELLQAQADLSFAVARRIDTERKEEDSLRRLAVHLGWRPDELPALTDTLTVSSDALQGTDPVPVSAPEAFDPTTRADLQALSAASQAAEAERRSATMSYLPDIGVFASYSIHGQDPFTADGDFWTVGFGLQWNVFSGFGRSAQGDRAAAASRIAETRYETALREAHAQLASARAAVAATRQAVQASLAADTAATVGTALMRRRFEEGLATATDLLAAESRTADARSRAIDAMVEYRLALARLRYVTASH